MGVEGRAVEDVFEGVHYVQGVSIDDGDGDLALFGLGEEVGDGFEVAGEDDAAGGGVDGAPVEIGAITATDDGLVGALGVVLGAGGEVLGVEDVGTDHDVLHEGVSAFEFQGVAGVETLDQVVDGDAVEGAGLGNEAEDGEASGFKGRFEGVFGESGAVGRDPVDDDSEEAFAEGVGGGLYGVGVEVTGEGGHED